MASFGEQIEWYEEVSSTMEVAATRGREGAPEGLVVIAERQQAGRGRLRRNWFSPAGGLWLSLLLRPTLPADSLRLLGLCFAVAAAEAVSEATGLPVGVRWPNDLYVGERKLGGLLVETHLSGESLDFAVMGLGVNVNIPAEDFPEGLRQPPTSILMETGTQASCQALLRAFLQRAEPLYHTLLAGGVAELVERWTKLDVGRGRRVRVSVLGHIAEGEACGIDSSGALVVKGERGPLAIGSGEVEWNPVPPGRPGNSGREG